MEMNKKKIKMVPNLTQIKIQKSGWIVQPCAVLKIICAKFSTIAMSASMRKKAKSDIFSQLTQHEKRGSAGNN